MKWKPTLSVAILGTGIGVWMMVSMGAVAVCGLTVLVSWFILSRVPAHERKFLLILLLIGLTIRWWTALAHYAYFIEGMGRALFGYDGESYSVRARYIFGILQGQMWTGTQTAREITTLLGLEEGFKGVVPVPNTYQVEYFGYMMAWFYLVFGYSPLGFKLLNVLISVCTVVVFYGMVRNAFPRYAARLAAVLAMLWLSTMAWSITSIREPAIIFALTLGFRAGVTLLERLRWGWGLALAASFFMLMALRPLSEAILGLWLIVTWLLAARYARGLRLVVLGLAAAVLLTPNLEGRTGLPLQRANPKKLALRLAHTQVGFVHTVGTTYRIYPERIYRPGAEIAESALTGPEIVRAWAVGMTHLAFSLLPWKIETRLQLMAFPQMMVWYVMLPLAALGTAVGLRYDARLTFAALVYIFILGSVLALSEGNFGSLFRHRDMLSYPVLMLSSLGLYRLLAAGRSMAAQRAVPEDTPRG